MSAYRLDVTIPGIPQRPNQLMRKNAIRIKQVESRRWRRNLWLVTVGKRPASPLKRARLTLVRGSSSCPDYDGLVGGFKFVIDALVENRIIEDDNMGVIGMPNFRWEKAPRSKGWIRVVVESVESQETNDVKNRDALNKETIAEGQ